MTRDIVLATKPRPACYLCGREGMVLHDGLQDRLFNVAGDWRLRQCPEESCGLIWLDPVPLEEEIVKAYAVYYHSLDEISTGQGRWSVRLLRGVWKAWARLTRVDQFQRHLDRLRPRGRLLDVGCGAGDRLARMRERGWTVEGVEVDPRSVQIAREKYGLTIHAAAIERAGLADGQYDLVTLSHVIEHVHDPVALLRECRRVLRPGGRLLAVTPHADGYGHRVFGQDWVDLEPPRHLYVFSAPALKTVFERAGFDAPEVTFLRGANTLFSPLGSLEIRRQGRCVPGTIPPLRTMLAVPLHQVWQACRFRFDPTYGDEIQVEATKGVTRV
ncbi:MAG: class I SAM-dependent methyltransferase [Candidatus Brocadiia bacterium]